MRPLVMVVFFTLMATEGIAVGTALVVYLRGRGWRDTAVGRHLAAFMGTLFALYVVTFVAIFVRDLAMDLVLLGCHTVFTAVLWQRAWLVWKAQHPGEGD